MAGTIAWRPDPSVSLGINIGPAGAGKSQVIEELRQPGQVLLDYTGLYAAIGGVQRGPDGRYPERLDGDPLLPLIAAVKDYAVEQAVTRELDGYVTSSSRDDIERLERITGQKAVIVDPGEEVTKARLADPVTGELSAECSKALARWYR